MDSEYDAVIVGGGPAGSTTARFAAENGGRVLMVEKRQEIGSPVRCGEGVTKTQLGKVGIDFSNKKWVVHEVKGAKVVSPGGIEFRIDEKYAGREVGTVIDRDMFDKHLAAEAVRAGADISLSTAATGLVKEGDKVVGLRLHKDGEDIDVKAGVVVGADGFESQVARWGGLDTSLSPKDISSGFQYHMVGVECDPDYCEFFLDNIEAGGYIWVFPRGRDRANVGVGVLASKLREPGLVKKHLDRWIAQRPGYSKGRVVEMVSGAVSLSAPPDRTVADGLLIVGDAARMADPMTGGGVANGCIAGKVAGETIAEAAKARDFSAEFLQRYENGWRGLLEDGLYRDYMAKEKLLTLKPDMLDKIVATLAEVGVEKLSIFDILQIIGDRHPEILEELQDLLL
jgi:digeranylgeranylglycerophospholipid reductase